MAHELEVVEGKGSMAYVGARPWHGFGQLLTQESTMEEWRVAAKLDWEYLKLPGFFEHNGEQHQIPRRREIIRSDNGRWLSTVSDNFNLVQPKDILNFYKDLTEHSGFTMETAGYLDLGRRIWALAKIGEKADVRKGDEVHGYLLLATACDGSLATTCQFTSIRVVCANTLGFAINQAEGRKDIPCIKVRHTSIFDPEVVKLQMGLGQKSFHNFVERAKVLADTFIGTKELDDLIVGTFATKNPETDQMEVSEKLEERIKEIFESGPGSNLPSASGTAWGFVNATTYYADHDKQERVKGGRQNSAWFGEGANLKTKAFRNAMALV